MIDLAIDKFFNELEIFEDINGPNHYKEKIWGSLRSFLDSNDISSALDVYNNFFNAYWIGIQQDENPYSNLVDLLRRHEESSEDLVLKQRDHFYHSVFVFIIGLCIYSKNTSFRKAFDNYALDKSKYYDFYNTCHEEFFYRWGITSLFHDIAYPIEILFKQINSYFGVLWHYPGKQPTDPIVHFNINNLETFMRLPKLEPYSAGKKAFYLKYPQLRNVPDDSLKLISLNISNSLSISYIDFYKHLVEHADLQCTKGFIDHSFFSAILVLNWYYELIKTTNWNPAYFYFPIVDIASSILMHNHYNYQLTKPPFSLGRLRPSQHPMSFLLILCDELQEWGRYEYGTNKLKTTFPLEAELYVDENNLEIHYMVEKDCKNLSYLDKISERIQKLLYIEDVFESIKTKGMVIK